jgi:predicted CxxxxCH...CXXCH cytochrome family protein
MGRETRPSPVFVAFVVVLTLSGVVAGLVSAGGDGGGPVETETPAAVADVTLATGNETPACERCHGVIATNTTERELRNEVANQPDHEFDLEHGDGQWCLDCHAEDDRNELRLPNGSTVDWTEANETRQCAACHGPVYEDWKQHIHGKWTGSWRNATPEKLCTDCHDPHDPEFHAIEPEPAPEEPPSGPAVATSVLPSAYYIGIGSLSVLIVGLLGYAATGLKND